MADEVTSVSARPRRIRVTCWSLAAALVLLFTAISFGLEGSTGRNMGSFQRGDQFAMIGLGLVGAAVILLFTRPRVEADAAGVRVRNVFRSYELPWSVIRAVRFDRDAAWASIELDDDETVPVLALQAVDRQHAVDAVRALRALHTSYGAGRGSADGRGGAGRRPATRAG
ncbi:PH domain-containing protein [Solwaraspora sp. WMMD406]|uniref:PH domain-containing protein n=1 Tax=Solwaraspora sp. WMMD406 TaxID=3016095 RepID=UPI002416BC7C|nr:PH domain-containing protein [Solwaraspora sp. WMMD406]MDG4766429.1 PH domain-containing protein [Solwaraspora sp. WMMD406]